MPPDQRLLDQGGEIIQGTKGSWNSFDNTIRDLKGNVLWQFDAEASRAKFQQHDPYVLEHVDWVNHIRNNEAHDEATLTGISTMAGVLGREAAYTGATALWDEVSASQMNWLPGEPDSLVLGDLDAVKNPVVPVPGR